jgi:glycosyltransferase involved in cell wall biosynthesis
LGLIQHEQDQLSVSVIICTHNPRRDYLERCLVALEHQTLSKNFWELIIVDNASTSEKAPPKSLAWHPRARVVSEPKLGLTPARLCGIRAAQGELLVFVDDDNVVDADFLETALHIGQERAFLGSWSGQCRPEFEQPPPEWTRRYWRNLVIREFGQDVWSNLPRLPDTMPCGAGLCVRRAVAERYLFLHESGKRSFQFDRRGSSLLSGGDNDLAACACDIGLGVGLVSSLRLTHLIPQMRLTESYLTQLLEGIAFTSTILDTEWGLAPAKRGFTGRIADFVRLLRVNRKDRAILRAAYRGRNRALQTIAVR